MPWSFCWLWLTGHCEVLWDLMRFTQHIDLRTNPIHVFAACQLTTVWNEWPAQMSTRESTPTVKLNFLNNSWQRNPTSGLNTFKSTLDFEISVIVARCKNAIFNLLGLNFFHYKLFCSSFLFIACYFSNYPLARLDTRCHKRILNEKVAAECFSARISTYLEQSLVIWSGSCGVALL